MMMIVLMVITMIDHDDDLDDNDVTTCGHWSVVAALIVLAIGTTHGGTGKAPSVLIMIKI